MTDREFSDQFDVLYNNITSNQAPGLNEYEKSVLLTKAQNEIVKNYFSAKANPKGDGFDDSPKRQADFATIVRIGDMVDITDTNTFDKRDTTKKYCYPDGDVFIVLNEQVQDSKWNYVVKPISYDEYDRLMSKPYKYPPKYQAWRLITDKQVSSGGTSKRVPGTATIAINTEGDGLITFKTNSLKEVVVELKLSNYPVEDIDDYTDWWEDIEFVDDEDFYSIVIPVPTNLTFDNIATLLINAPQYQKGPFPFSSINVSSAIANKNWTLVNIDNKYKPSAGQSQVNYEATLQAKDVVINADVPVVELIGRFGTGLKYSVRYVKKPYPIILEDLTGTDLSIDGKYSVPMEPVCELPEQLHEEILQRAVELAKVAWTATGQDNVQLEFEAGKRSE